MNIQIYISKVRDDYKHGRSTEHTYRGYLKDLIEEINNGIKVTNEPKRQACGAPDLIAERKNVPVGFIETKDIGIDLDKTEKGEQLGRYQKSLGNLILTDYLEFRFYHYENKIETVSIAELRDGKIHALTENFDQFTTLITDFCAYLGQTIHSSELLAKMMAVKARLMENMIYNTVYWSQ